MGDLNRQIVDYLRVHSGPPVVIRSVDADAEVAQWHADRRRWARLFGGSHRAQA